MAMRGIVTLLMGMLLWCGCGAPPKEDPYFLEKFPARYERISKALSVLEVNRYLEDMRHEGWALIETYPAGDGNPNQQVVVLQRPVYDGKK